MKSLANPARLKPTLREYDLVQVITETISDSFRRRSGETATRWMCFC